MMGTQDKWIVRRNVPRHAGQYWANQYGLEWAVHPTSARQFKTRVEAFAAVDTVPYLRDQHLVYLQLRDAIQLAPRRRAWVLERTILGVGVFFRLGGPDSSLIHEATRWARREHAESVERMYGTCYSPVEVEQLPSGWVRVEPVKLAPRLLSWEYEPVWFGVDPAHGPDHSAVVSVECRPIYIPSREFIGIASESVQKGALVTVDLDARTVQRRDDELQKRNDTQAETITNADRSTRELQDGLAKARGKVRDLEQLADRQRERIGTVARACDDARGCNTRLSADLVAVQSTVCALTRERDVALNTCEQLRRLRDELRSERDDARRCLRERDARVEELLSGKRTAYVVRAVSALKQEERFHRGRGIAPWSPSAVDAYQFSTRASANACAANSVHDAKWAFDVLEVQVSASGEVTLPAKRLKKFVVMVKAPGRAPYYIENKSAVLTASKESAQRFDCRDAATRAMVCLYGSWTALAEIVEVDA